jgi:hypothetical protein
MDNNNKETLSTVKDAVAAGDPAALPPEQIVEQLRSLRVQIQHYTQLPPSTSRVLHRAANADPEFVKASINAVGASPTVQNAVGRTADALWQETDDAGRWTAVEDELQAMLQGVRATNLVRRHRIGLTALQTYSISRQLVRQPEHEDLLPHVQEMKRLNRFGRTRKKVQPGPQPPAPPAPPQV